MSAARRELLIGTTNPAKLRNLLAALDDSCYLLRKPSEVLSELPEVGEDARRVEENALRKATAFSAAANLPSVSLDYALYFDGVGDAEQPGMNVRRIPGGPARPSDDELLRHYSGLFERLGGQVGGRWVVGLAASTPTGRVASTEIELPRRFVSTPSAARVEGYPLASLQLIGERYVAELDEDEERRLSQAVLREPLRALLGELFG